MSDYAYPYDETGTKSSNKIVNESHDLNYVTNKWGCIIPWEAPFYKRSLDLVYVDEKGDIHEMIHGVHYYLTHYYKKGSNIVEQALYGGIQLTNTTLKGSVVFKEYQTLGDKFTTTVERINNYLADNELENPRNAQWEDVIVANLSVPEREQIDTYEEAIDKDEVVGSLHRLAEAFEAINNRQNSQYDDLIDRVAKLGTRIQTEEILIHEGKAHPHEETFAQVGALGKDQQAVNALKAYGKTLSELVTLINTMGVTEQEVETLFKLVGGELVGSLTMDSKTAVIRNNGGSAMLDFRNNTLLITAENDVKLISDSKKVSAYKEAVAHPDQGYSLNGDSNAKAMIHPDVVAKTVPSMYAFRKLVTLTAGEHTCSYRVDDVLDMYVDGVKVSPAKFTTTAGEHDITFVVTNTLVTQTYLALRFDRGDGYEYVDESWWTKLISAGSKDFNLMDEMLEDVPPTSKGGYAVSLNSGRNSLNLFSEGTESTGDAQFKGYYVIHAGNLSKYLPATAYEDSVLYTENSDTVVMAGRGIEGSPLYGTVIYTNASAANSGITKLISSIYNTRTDAAASSKAVYDLVQLINEYVPNTRTVNGHKLTKNITLTKADIGLSNVDNTAPSDKPAPTKFKAEVAKKSPADHTHVYSDFTNIPTATSEVYGVSNIDTKISDRDDIAVAPYAFKDQYSKLLKIKAELADKMPSEPFRLMQYGGFDYLPIPVQGNYASAGWNQQYVAMVREANGRLMILRNGYDMHGEYVYYMYITLKSDDSVDKTVKTSTVYQPTFIPAGTHVRYVGRGNSDVFPIAVSDGTYYIVLTHGTMNAEKHTGYEINGINEVGQDRTYFLYKRSIYAAGFSYSDHCKVYLFKASLDDAELTGTATFEKVALNGTDVDGNTKQSHPFNFFNVVEATSKDTNIPITLRLDNGYWSGGDNRHSTQNMMYMAKDNKFRGMYSGSQYRNNSSSSMWIIQGFSFEIDLDTSTVTSDVLDYFPLETRDPREGNGNAFSKFTSYRWYSAAPNNNSQLIQVGDEFYGYRFDGSRQLPLIFPHAVTSGTTWDYVQASSKQGHSTAWTVTLDGNYGSVLKQQPKSMAVVGYYIHAHDINGNFTRSKCDPNSRYMEGLNGWGPTTDRVLLDKQQHRDIILTPNMWTEDKLAGYTLYDGHLTSHTKHDGENTSGTITISAELFDQAKQEMESKATYSSSYDVATRGRRLYISVFGEPGDKTYKCFVHFWHWFYRNSAKTASDHWMWACEATLTIVGNEVTEVNIGKAISNVRVSSTATGLHQNDPGVYCCQNFCCVLEDGNYAYGINVTPSLHYVGNAGFYTQILFYDKDFSFIREYHRWQRTYRPDGMAYHPDWGIFNWVESHAGQSLDAVLFGTSMDTWTGNNGQVTLLATAVATGAVLYFTEVAEFFWEGTVYELPAQTFDLELLFPTTYKNGTFYFYVEMDDETSEIGYTVKTTLEEDSIDEGLMYIGYATTVDSVLTEINIVRAARIGNVYELQQHMLDTEAHGKAFIPTASEYGLERVANMSVKETAEIPTFKDVFDTWERFVLDRAKLATEDQTPTWADEVNTWSYDEATDSIKCTKNTNGYVGFISPTAAEDYVFDTILSSTNGDDDTVGVVLGYVVEGSDMRIYTLDVPIVRNYAQAHTGPVKSNFGLWFNYGQSNQSSVVDNTDVADKMGGWSSNAIRVRAVKEGSKLRISRSAFTKSKDPADHQTMVATIEIDLDEYPELKRFSGAVQYGYSAKSQASSTYTNIQRPDENYLSYYSSGEIVRDVANKSAGNFRMVRGTVIAPGTIPVPDGFTADQCHATVSLADSGVDYIVATKLGINGLDVTAAISGYKGTSMTKITQSVDVVLNYVLVAIKES